MCQRHFLLDPAALENLCWALVTCCFYIAPQRHFCWRCRAPKNRDLDWNGVGELRAGCKSAVAKYRSDVREIRWAIRVSKPRTSGYILRHVPQPKVCDSGADARQSGSRESRRRRGGVGTSSAQASDARDASCRQTPARRVQL